MLMIGWPSALYWTGARPAPAVHLAEYSVGAIVGVADDSTAGLAACAQATAVIEGLRGGLAARVGLAQQLAAAVIVTQNHDTSAVHLEHSHVFRGIRASARKYTNRLMPYPLILNWIWIWLTTLLRWLLQMGRRGTLARPFACKPNRRPTWINPTTRSRRKPDWVIRELVRIKAWTPNIGCRRVADTFQSQAHGRWIQRVHELCGECP